jgi:PKD repeat protein
MTRLRARFRVLGSLTTVMALTVTGLAVATITAPVAAADPGPVQTTTGGMVTAESLPTVQINGVVWSQVIVGNKVYAGGNFTKARPAGAAPGTNETPRSYLLAYDINTGVLDTTFAPTLNGQVRALSLSPDGKRLYVGGDFTTINGGTRNRIAAFDINGDQSATLATGFLASADYSVYAIASTNAKVYIGGDFNSARGVTRKKLAAFAAADGALTGWTPQADRKVSALVLTANNSRVIVGGAFGSLSGKASYGSGSVDAVAGTAQTWNANSVIRNYGPDSAILGLSTDGSTIYGNGFVYNGSGNLEGAFAADQFGNIKWIEDCHGDTYATWPSRTADVVYTVSHAHYCGNVGGQPQTDPWTFQRAMAFTKSVTGTLTNNGDAAYANYSGRPSPSVVSWFPQVAMGSFTGKNQGAWTVTGNDQYVLMGGEFPRVNLTDQQGIARFAVLGTGPGQSKGLPPVLSGGNMVPSLQALSGGTVRATVTTNWDRDDSQLTYQLLRNGQVVNSSKGNSTFWNRPKVSVTDTGLTNGTTYSYQIRTVDAGGNTTTGSPVSFKATATTQSTSTYAKLVSGQGASAYWRLGEFSGSIFDWDGTNDGTLASGTTRNVAGAISGDGNKAVTFNGTDSGRMSTKSAVAGPLVYSVEAWIKTTTTSGGKIVGFGSSQTGTSGNYDRHLYMDNSGKLLFGNYAGGIKTVISPKAYNDGQWHQVVGTLGASGMSLYVDGVKVANDAATKSAQKGNGYWRIGGDNLDAWTNRPTSRNFNGTIDEVSVYPLVLTDQQIADQYQAAGPNMAPTADFTTAIANRAVTFNASGSSDPDGSIASYAWDYGNGTTGTGVNPTYTYPADGTYPVKLTVTDNLGGTATVTKNVTVAGNKLPVAAYTWTAAGLAVSFNGAGSSDPDGSIASYSWDFGDGASGTGATASHAYGAAGGYTVSLTVTDNQGESSTTTKLVAAGNGQPAVVASDAFGRTVTTGFGTADEGGAWTTSAPSLFAVNNGAGTFTLAKGATQSIFLNAVAQADVDMTVDVKLDKVGNDRGTITKLAARRIGTSDYRLAARVAGSGVVLVQLTKVINGTESALIAEKQIGLTYAAGDTLRMRVRVTGGATPTISGNVWKAGTTEPATWQATATDATATAILGAGGVGLVSQLSSFATNAPVVVSFDNLGVRAGS